MKTSLQQGQALITLLFFMIIGVTLLTAAAFVTLGNVASTSSAEQGTIAFYNAEAGAEDALLELLRYPPGSTSPYTGTSTDQQLPNSMGTYSISISPSPLSSPPPTTLTITAIGKYASAKRKIQVVETDGNNGWQVASWQEIN
jgi:Tfp pilus assembly protein PilX